MILTEIHHDANTISDDVAVTLDKRAMQQRNCDCDWARTSHVLCRQRSCSFLGLASALGNLVHDSGGLPRHRPGILNLLNPLWRLSTGTAKVRADDIKQELSWVGVCRNRVTDLSKVAIDIVDCAKVTRLSTREEQKLVEQLKGRRRRLVDTRDDDDLPCFSLVFQPVYYTILR